MLKDVLNKKLIFEVFAVALLVAGLHKLALSYSLYWAIEWFDIPMHFLGGFLIGILALFVFFSSGWISFTKNIRDWQMILFITVSSVLIVGLAWELWELFVGFTDLIADRADTILDLIMDTTGAVAAFYYGKGKIHE